MITHCTTALSGENYFAWRAENFMTCIFFARQSKSAKFNSDRDFRYKQGKLFERKKERRQNIVPIIRINFIIAFNWCGVVSCLSSSFFTTSNISYYLLFYDFSGHDSCCSEHQSEFVERKNNLKMVKIAKLVLCFDHFLQLLLQIKLKLPSDFLHLEDSFECQSIKTT